MMAPANAADTPNAAAAAAAATASAPATNQRRPSAPYGHACLGCSRAKSRCIGRTADAPCERCRRLQRDCEPSGVVRKGGRLSRRARSPGPSASKATTAALEKKLDNLVSMLASQGSLSLSNTTAPAPVHVDGVTTTASTDTPNTVTTNVPPPRGMALFENDAYTAARFDQQSLPSRSSYLPTPSSSTLPGAGSSLWFLTEPLSDQGGPSTNGVSEDDECLDMFKNYHLRSFPLMHFGPQVRPCQIKAEKPLLWLAIRTVCCKTSSKRKALDLQFRQEFANRFIVNMERSMDLLLGLLTYMSWWITMRHMKKKVLCSYSSMAVSLVFDLRLDRLGRWNPCKETDSIAAFANPLKTASPPVDRTNEERRAVIACFCICATVSSFLRTPPMRWTPHMEDTLEHLAKSPEVFGDEQLAAMARALRIGEDVLTASGWRFFEPEAYTPPKPPPMVHVKALRSNLDALRQSLGPELIRDKTVRAYLSWTEAMINELPLLHRPAPNTSGPGWIDFDRAECFHACVEALRSFIDTWFLFDHYELFGMFMGLTLHFAQSTHTIYRLSMAPKPADHSDGGVGGLEDPGWDRESVRNAFDLPRILTKGADQFASVSQVVGLEMDDGDDDPYLFVGVGLRRTAEQWLRRFAETDTRRMPRRGGATTSYTTPSTTTTDDATAGSAGETAPIADGFADGEDLPMPDFSAGFWMPDLFESWDSM